jgi:hypothetical protein
MTVLLLRLFQNFSFERATLDLTGKTVPLAGFSKANFKTNRVLKLALLLYLFKFVPSIFRPGSVKIVAQGIPLQAAPHG